MSNLIKASFVAFAQNDKLVIDGNKNNIIKPIETIKEENDFSKHTSMEEALAEALILDAELEDTDFNESSILSLDASDLTEASDLNDNSRQLSEDVIKSAKAEADEIINEAHNEAEQLRASAYEEAEQIKLQAKEEGYKTGYDEVLEVARKETAEKEAAFEKKLQDNQIQLQEQTAQLVKETENHMVEILCQLIPSITGVVIDNQKDVLLYMVNKAMQNLDNSKHFVIKVSCNDYEDLLERKDQIYGALNSAIDMEIFEDAKLTSMQCLIETDNGIVDVSLDSQLDNLITALKLMIKE